MFADTVLMVRPDSFGYNHQTAESNSFQHSSLLDNSAIKKQAVAESEKLRQKLVDYNIHVLYMYQPQSMELPDAVFPNNWFSTHADGTIIIYPMCSPSRRAEYNPKIIEYLKHNFIVKQILDFRDYTQKDQFLEGTGSLVLDLKHQMLFAAKSIRTHHNLVNEIVSNFNLKPCTLTFNDDFNQPIYHTNVCLSVGNGFMVIAKDNLNDDAEKKLLNELLSKTSHEIITISKSQLNHFCGNILQLMNKKKEPILVMSTTAFKAFLPSQIKQLEKHTSIIHSDISTIETTGGGSARCMIAEIFLKPKNQN